MTDNNKQETEVQQIPINLSLHTNPNYNALLGTNGKLANLKVSKPDKETWFMTHKDWRQELYIAECSVKNSLKKQSYLVQGNDDATHQELLSSLDTVRWCCCHLVATSTGSLMIWPRKMHVDDGDEPKKYHTTAAEAAEDAEQGFIKMKWKGGGYDWVSPRTPEVFKEPVWPKEQSMLELLEIAFRGYVINNMDHPQVMIADGRA